MRFSDELDESWFGGMVSEVWNPRRGRYEKKRGTPRNEPLDTWVYAYAATHHQDLRLHRATAADWDARERRLQQNAEALGVRPVVSREPAPPAPAADDSRETSPPPAPRAPPPQSVRSMVFAVVGMAERQRSEAAPPDVLGAWRAAVPATASERGLHQELLAALQHAQEVPSALAPELLERARRFLSGLPVAHNVGGQRRPLRGVRNKGLR